MRSGVAFTSRVVGVLSFSAYLWAKAGDGDFGVAVNDRLLMSFLLGSSRRLMSCLAAGTGLDFAEEGR